jgi:hypothetical protein
MKTRIAMAAAFALVDVSTSTTSLGFSNPLLAQEQEAVADDQCGVRRHG